MVDVRLNSGCTAMVDVRTTLDAMVAVETAQAEEWCVEEGGLEEGGPHGGKHD